MEVRRIVWITYVAILLLMTNILKVTSQDCLPDCQNGNCENSCPPDLFLHRSKDFQNISRCIYPTSTQATSIYSTTENAKPPFESKFNSTGENITFICVSSCPGGVYKDYLNNSCLSCNSLCTNCTGSGYTVDVCTCRHGNDTNGTCLVERNNEINKDGMEDWIIIAAAAGGGGFVIIIILIIVACCCCRRREQEKRSRMSVLLESRDETDDSPAPANTTSPTKKLTTLQRQQYENTKFDDTKFAKEAQRNQDKMFRYVKDPVTGQKSRISEESQNRVSEIYTNASTIKFHRNLSEERELDQLPQAPKPPSQPKGKSVNIGFSNQAFEQESYEDMSGRGQENYTPFDPNEEPQENYENYEKENQVVGDSDDELEDYENIPKSMKKDDDEEQEDYENFVVNTSGQKTSKVTEDDLPSEDYENFTVENPYMNFNYKS